MRFTLFLFPSGELAAFIELKVRLGLEVGLQLGLEFRVGG